MGRPALPLGTHGEIQYCRRGSAWRAMTKFRDFDGITRRVERGGRTKAAAERALKIAIRDRTGPAGGAITGETRLRDVAEQWFSSVEDAVAGGTRSPSTADTYRSNLDRHVLPGLGGLRLRELTVPVVDRFLGTVRRNAGTASAKTTRSVLSGVLGLVVRHGALTANPVRETERIERGRAKGPRALTPGDRAEWLAKLDGDPVAVRRDLPDLCRFMMATGVRIGEALAVMWSEVDLDGGTVDVNHTVIRIKGRGLIRKATKSEAGERTLNLPEWAVRLLRRRQETTDHPDGPVFADSLGGLRDPSNTRRDLRSARGSEGFAWVTSHVFRKTAATILDEANLSARVIADQLGHARPSMTQDVYLGRKVVDPRAAAALESAAGITESRS
ncbi:MAG TPA: tyrosine-type recombinase/integrase [Pseudonocardiaceae bacterium]